jgi:hypothetical protein
MKPRSPNSSFKTSAAKLLEKWTLMEEEWRKLLTTPTMGRVWIGLFVK